MPSCVFYLGNYCYAQYTLRIVVNDVATKKPDNSLKKDASVDFNIAGWQDDFPDKPKPNTASAQVSIVDTAFFIPLLNRKRRIGVYLAKSYATGKKTYPVIYCRMVNI